MDNKAVINNKCNENSAIKINFESVDNPHNLTWHTGEMCVHLKSGKSFKG